jgi:hypothetical protein
VSGGTLAAQFVANVFDIPARAEGIQKVPAQRCARFAEMLDFKTTCSSRSKTSVVFKKNRFSACRRNIARSDSSLTGSPWRRGV